MNAQRKVVQVTTLADGSAIAYSERVSGKIEAIHYVKTDFDNGVDFTITSEDTAQSLWTESDVNASAIRAPRQATHLNTSGAAALFAAGGAAVLEPIVLANDRVKIVIANGGNVKSGAFHIVLS